MYADPAVDESFYSLAWSYTSEGLPVVAVAGKNAIIRLIYPTNPGYSSDETVSCLLYSLFNRKVFHHHAYSSLAQLNMCVI